MIEKQFTLARTDGGVDSTFPMESQEMVQLVIEFEQSWQALGRVQNGSTQAEQASLMFRRSLYVVRDVKAGEVLARDNVWTVYSG